VQLVLPPFSSFLKPGEEKKRRGRGEGEKKENKEDPGRPRCLLLSSPSRASAKKKRGTKRKNIPKEREGKGEESSAFSFFPLTTRDEVQRGKMKKGTRRGGKKKREKDDLLHFSPALQKGGRKAPKETRGREKRKKGDIASFLFARWKRRIQEWGTRKLSSSP